MNILTFRLILPVLICTISIGSLSSQEIIPKREFRGAWVATVSNIDFPSKPGLSKKQFEEEWSTNIEFLAETGLNAVIAQIRPSGDALYPSKIAPWSKYLTGKQGTKPTDDFDPLQFMIRTTHEKNMEFHAWLNPYRAAMDTITADLSEQHPFSQHPEWFIRYGGRVYFNPALPEVRNYITEVVLEIIMEYDVDGIHFDDYFYPYPAAGETFPDGEDFSKYGYGYLSIDEWRRSNVNALIAQVSEMIKSVSPHVKFGISPFGVWRNKGVDPAGSNTTASITAYDNLYADVRMWLEKGWIDYAAPQLYWQIGFDVADYEQLLDWWHKNAFDRHIYTGNAIYKVGNHPDAEWRSPNQIPLQVSLNRIFPNVRGCILYNTNSLMKNRLGVQDSLANHYFKYPALWPEMKHISEEAPAPPKLYKAFLRKGVLKMKCDLPKDGHNLVVYKFENRKPGDYNNPANIHQILRIDDAESIMIEDADVSVGKKYTYAVSATNRLHNESILSEWRAVEIRKNRAKRIK